jgi:hypothetical protein
MGNNPVSRAGKGVNGCSQPLGVDVHVGGGMLHRRRGPHELIQGTGLGMPGETSSGLPSGSIGRKVAENRDQCMACMACNTKDEHTRSLARVSRGSPEGCPTR